MSDAPVQNNYWVDNCTSPYTTPVLKDGPWRIVVWAEDAAGNESPFERRDLTVDTTAPDTYDHVRPLRDPSLTQHELRVLLFGVRHHIRVQPRRRAVHGLHLA
jgi:hypothetical protein